jgi:ABC transport system ATP-binding/permease protein
MRRESPGLAASAVQRPVLVWERAGAKPVEFELEGKARLTIGRDPSNGLVLASSFVSKLHAVLEHRDGRYLIEDQHSANGTKVNGAPIQVSALGPGDVIEIGDQRLVFVDRARRGKPASGAALRASSGVSAAGGLGKTARLALAAVGTLVVMGALMLWLMPSGPPPSPPSGPVQSPGPSPSAPRVPSVARADSELVRRIESQAATSGVRVADALYDEGLAQLHAQRYPEAVRLFAAALRHDGKNESARARLLDAQAEWEQAIAEHMARADRAFGELRYRDAVLEWEQVTQLAEEGDSRLATAKAGIERATKLGQPR